MSTSNTSTNSNQQNLADSGPNERPLMLEKGNYIPWESRFRRFLDNKLEDGERMWNSIQNGPYQRPMVVDPTNPTVPILESLSKMTEGNKKQYIAYVRVMNYLLQAIPMRHLRLMDEFDKFATKEGESLESVHERLTTLVNIMDRNNVHPIPMAINTKFLNFFQPEWRKYVTMDGRVDIQTKNAGYGGNANKNVGRNRTQGFNAGDESNQIIQRVPRTESTPGKENVQCYNCTEKGHYARECQKPKVRDSKYFREQMLLAMKDEAGSNLSNEENDFMLDTSYGEELEELTAAVMLMVRLQPADENAETVPSYDTKAVSQVHASSKVHEQVSHRKRKSIIQTMDDDQIDLMRSNNIRINIIV
ncbi:retrovirus-related pol polyprotein from transposon TNT 1-94 [Tanacetum coccineum]